LTLFVPISAIFRLIPDVLAAIIITDGSWHVNRTAGGLSQKSHAAGGSQQTVMPEQAAMLFICGRIVPACRIYDKIDEAKENNGCC
jgi:hypothetical protein